MSLCEEERQHGEVLGPGRLPEQRGARLVATDRKPKTLPPHIPDQRLQCIQRLLPGEAPVVLHDQHRSLWDGTRPSDHQEASQGPLEAVLTGVSTHPRIKKFLGTTKAWMLSHSILQSLLLALQTRLIAMGLATTRNAPVGVGQRHGEGRPTQPT
jgi:hypothetical protein